MNCPFARRSRNLATPAECDLIGAAQEAAALGFEAIARALYRAASKLALRRSRDRRNRARSAYRVKSFLAESKPWDLDRAREKTVSYYGMRAACGF